MSHLLVPQDTVEKISLEGDTVVRAVSLSNGQVVRSEVGNVRLAPSDLSLVDKADWLELRRNQLPMAIRPEGYVRTIDLFCGCGGMSTGVGLAAFAINRSVQHQLACDLADDALSVFSANHGQEGIEKLDLSELSSIPGSSKTPIEVRITRKVTEETDLLIAGPPCQGHSNLNNHTRRRDPKNELYFKTIRAVELLMPKFVMIENVPTVTRDHSRVVDRSIEYLTELGYSCDEGVVSLTAIGLPQTRKRHILIAQRAGEKSMFESIKSTVSRFERNVRSVEFAIGDLLESLDDSLLNSVAGMADVTRARVDYLFDNDLYNLPDEVRPDCHRTKKHSYGSVYGRMKWDKPAPTITRGFLTMGQGRFVHPKRRSTLTPREAARVQGFPDFFDFSSLTTRKSLASVIGNAVPPRLSYVFALDLLR